MARPLWKGTLGFGLVYLPVEVYSAVRDVMPHFHFLRENARRHRKLVEKHEVHAWGFRVTTETDVSGRHFVIMQTGPVTTLIWFCPTYESLYERGSR